MSDDTTATMLRLQLDSAALEAELRLQLETLADTLASMRAHNLRVAALAGSTELLCLPGQNELDTAIDGFRIFFAPDLTESD